MMRREVVGLALMTVALMSCSSPEPEPEPASLSAPEPPPLAAARPDLSAYPNVPQPNEEQLRELYDVERDLAALHRGEPAAAGELADDLSTIARTGQPPAEKALLRLVDSLSRALQDTPSAEDEYPALGRATYVLMHAGALSDEEMVLLAESFAESLRAMGVSDAAVAEVLAAVSGVRVGS